MDVVSELIQKIDSIFPIILIRQFKKQMSQPLRRNLRDRKPPKTFNSEEQEIDILAAYTRATYQKEFKNPAAQLNQQAKLLIKFLNNINKSTWLDIQGCRESIIDNKKDPTNGSIHQIAEINEKTELSTKGKIPKSKGDPYRPPKSEPKKVKQSYNFPGQTNQNIKYLKNDNILNKIKGMTAESAVNMLQLEKAIGASFPNFSSRKMQFLKATTTTPQNGTHQEQNSSKDRFFLKDKIKNGKIVELENKLNSKPTMSEDKLFKRSSYHVAIAYHIYIKKVKQKGVNSGHEIDPTYHARKLKEEINKNL